MEIGITLDNKLVYNKELKINKKVVKTGLTIAGIGLVCIALSVALTPSIKAYALASDSAQLVTEVTEDSKLILDTFKNSAQFQDFQELFYHVFDNMSNTDKAIVNDGITVFMDNFEKTIGDTVSKMDYETMGRIIAERKISYIKSGEDMFNILKKYIY